MRPYPKHYAPHLRQAAEASLAAQSSLATLREIGKTRFDPADKFEAYIAMTLCKAILQKLETHFEQANETGAGR